MSLFVYFDFASGRISRHSWIMWFVPVLAGVTFCTALATSMQLQEEVKQMADKKDQLKAASRKHQAVVAIHVEKPMVTAPLSYAVQLLSYPWNDVLTNLEIAAGEEVNLSVVEHSVKERRTTLTVFSSSYQHSSELIDRLESANSRSMTWTVRSVTRTSTGVRSKVEGQPSDH